MFELFKLAWDFVVMRDQASKGQLNWRVWVYGFGFALVQYCIGLPAVLLYEKHPQYKPVFIFAMVLIVVNFIAFMWWAIRSRSRQSASPTTGSHPN
jgi:Na+/melibiose symporter-like transporter